MTCRKARDFVATKPLGVSPGGAGPGADLGGSSNYSGEGFVPLTLKSWRRGLKAKVMSFVGVALDQGFYLARGKSGVVLQHLGGFLREEIIRTERYSTPEGRCGGGFRDDRNGSRVSRS